ncbi:DUF4239 domain-containing protein [Ferrimonas balearica]|nr:DUF4239 domain-containing protein [Ferrimonas balearica]
MTLSDIGLGVGIALANIAVIFAIYALTRRIWGGRQTTETKDLAGSVIFRIASLHGLILALVFAQELIDYSEIRADLVSEATAVADIFNDIRRFDAGEEVTAEVQGTLAAYLRHVVNHEWAELSETGKLTAEGWILREAIYETALNLAPTTLRQTDLRAHMVAKAQAIAELRQKRENNAARELSGLFWFAALAGVICVAVPYFTYPPTPLHLALLSLYGGYTGVIMFVIFAFSDPFANPGALPPTAFTQLLAGEMGQY